MQNIKFYVSAAETLGVVRDYANAKSATAPALVRGVETQLKIRLFVNSDGSTPYPIALFSNIAAWQWAMDKDFSESTNYILEADNASITVATVTDSIDGTDSEFTELTIPIPNMNTIELADWLGTDESKSGLSGELVGFDANGKAVFVLQIKNFTVRNRITSLGSPTPIDPDYLTAVQVYALMQAAQEYQFSIDGVNDWHATYTSADRYYRERRGISGANWGAALPLGRNEIVVDAVNHSFSTTAGQAAMVVFTKTELGIASDSEPQVSLWSVLNSVKTKISDASYNTAWSSTSLTITYYQAWAAGDWILKLS